jgi:hypothetical protein
MDNPFYIYTTGLGCWLNPALIKIWNTDIRKMIFNNIHNNFKNIIIEHYDPLLDIDNKPFNQNLLNQFTKGNLRFTKGNPCFTEGNLRFIKEYIEPMIANDEKHTLIDVKVKSTFIYKYLDLNIIEELNKNNKHFHLLFDFAHLISYMSNKQIKLINGEIIYNNINSLYVGYLEDLIPKIIAKQRLFTMTANGIVTTFIDKIISLNYGNNIIYLQDVFEKIFQKIKNKIELYLRNNNKSVLLTDHLELIKYYEFIITKIINEEVMSDILEKELYNIMIDDIHKMINT